MELILASENLTCYLTDWKAGNDTARDSLLPLVYDELRRLAASYMRDERSARTLQPTALVHETWLRLVSQRVPDWEGRSHFFGVAAHLMREILVDHARHNKRAKRGGGVPHAPIDKAVNAAPKRDSELLALDDALTGLAGMDPRKSRIVELRYFGGFTIEETAEALDISVATVAREQRLAEAWLYRELKSGSHP
jgi:RNA polymerase sigma-70 factor (ECF subfamily)